MQAWRTIRFDVTKTQEKVLYLLEQWRTYRSSRICYHHLEIQEHKDKMEKLSESLTTGFYCVDDDELEQISKKFEQELDRFKSSVHNDLLQGLTRDKKDKTK